VNFVGSQHNQIGFLKEIARGVRSKVFLVSSEGKVAAAKLFFPEHSQFAEKEFQFGKDLNHPNLNKIDKAIDILGYRGVLMPYLEGKKLSAYYETDLSHFLALFKSLLLGLTFLHEQNIIHRDIKPENVIVEKGLPKLLDFDLATYLDRPEPKRSLVGTIAYFSPEEIKGEPATKASDLYAAGIILYRYLTGEVPFTGSVTEVMKAHQNSTPRLASSFNKTLEPFDTLLRRLLDKNPNNRFASAKDLSNALEEAEKRVQMNIS
jgi:serine/threonine-protein kinase